MKTLGIIALGIVAGLVALFVLFYVLTMGEYPVAETVSQDPSIPHITIDWVTYHAETFGDSANPVMIVIHGGPGGDYRSILSLQALSDQYSILKRLTTQFLPNPDSLRPSLQKSGLERLASASLQACSIIL